MEEKYKLLDQIHHDSSMSAYTIKVLINELGDRDNKITPYLEEIQNKYIAFETQSKNILEELGLDSKDPSLMSKMGSSMAIDKEVRVDNSDAAIADMMIQGVNMGLNKIVKRLKDYDKELSKEHKKLARDFLNFQESVIENLKTYL